jgi:hypothetical protein
MKKILLFLVITSLFAACDKTENEQAIENLFIGDDALAENKTLNEYNAVELDEAIYRQDFNDPDSRGGWSVGTDNYSTRAIDNGQYFIQAKKGYYTWIDFDIDNNRNFQIEVYMSCNFLLGGTELGLVCGVNNSTYAAILFGNEVFYVGYYDGSKWIPWYAKNDAPYNETDYRNAIHLYTIRKVDNKLSVFMDQKYLCSTEYTLTLNNIGFYLSTQGIIEVDYIYVDYITEKE